MRAPPYRKAVFLGAVAIFITACFVLYSHLETSNAKRKESLEVKKRKVRDMEQKLAMLEGELQTNEHIINEVREQVYKAVGGGGGGAHARAHSDKKARDAAAADNSIGGPASAVQQPLSPMRSKVDAGYCSLADEHSTKPDGDIQMLDVYDLMTFDNPDGGAWKQGWPIIYDKSVAESKQPQLQVFVVPHSHCDPGWIKTYEEYFSQQVVHILDSMVDMLTSEPRMKFIYAEMSFFEKWFAIATPDRRQGVKKLLGNGQLEIVSGAWVMTDEANAHYYSILSQMMDGHLWLLDTFNYRPTNHWSIDPFGLSPTVPWLMSAANLTGAAVQRVHYAVKKHLAKNRQLLFKWRQLWDRHGNMDLLTRIFPFYSYDVPHTCGPEPAVCCQFDFKRLPGTGLSCPWGTPAVKITADNVAERASTLLDQYRKLSQLYGSNVLLVPLGDDFRYDSPTEWRAQFDNYHRLFEHMNNMGAWNVQAQFGTLKDYFAALHARMRQERHLTVPTLSGDFFTYADRDDHYWSGYYTSRPFYKRMERALMHALRSAEFMFTWSWAVGGHEPNVKEYLERHYAKLVAARRALGLFQHHDGITGTAKDYVVVDYGEKMRAALDACKSVTAAGAHVVLTARPADFAHERGTVALFDVDERRPSHESLPGRPVLRLAAQAKRTIVLYNALATARHDYTCVRVDTDRVAVRDASGRPVRAQLEPVLLGGESTGRIELAAGQYMLCFVAALPPLGVARYEVSRVESGDGDVPPVDTVKLSANFDVQTSDFRTSPLDSTETLAIESSDYKLTFSAKTGYLRSVYSAATGRTHSAELGFVRYGARRKGEGNVQGGDSLSGAYLFLPNGPAHPLSSEIKGHKILTFSGPLSSLVAVKVGSTVLHTVRLSRVNTSVSGQSFAVDNVVDVRAERNYELAMRLKTDVKSGDTFYTDLNGLQMIRRRRFGKLPLQAHFYPMAASASIEDADTRVSLFSAQPLGAASLEPGGLDVMLDRRLQQDDDRGLFQGVTDNKPTPDTFWVVWEPQPPKAFVTDGERAAYHSALAHHTGMQLLHPLVTLVASEVHDVPQLLPSASMLSAAALPCDAHLVSARTLDSMDAFALVLHRPILRCGGGGSGAGARLACRLDTACEIPPSMFDDRLKVQWDRETSLTLMYDKAECSGDAIALKPMDLRTFKLRFA